MLSHTTAYITPAENPYTVREEQKHVQVCLELAPRLSPSLDLRVYTSDTTATGRNFVSHFSCSLFTSSKTFFTSHVTLSAGGFDYVPVNMIIRKSQFTLSSDSVMGCIDVEVVDDQLSEMEEGFVIEVANGSFILTQITVNIESSDGR